MAWFIDGSLLGMRVTDVLRSVDYTLSREDVGKDGVRAVGVGRGALWLLYSAALDSRVQAAVCDECLLSYAKLAGANKYLYGADIFVPDVLRHFDLPDIAASIAKRRLVLLSPVDGMKQPVAISSAREAYGRTAQRYAAQGLADGFRIAERQPGVELADQYLRALAG
jgi:hypothetical protein